MFSPLRFTSRNESLLVDWSLRSCCDFLIRAAESGRVSGHLDASVSLNVTLTFYFISLLQFLNRSIRNLNHSAYLYTNVYFILVHKRINKDLVQIISFAELLIWNLNITNVWFISGCVTRVVLVLVAQTLFVQNAH